MNFDFSSETLFHQLSFILLYFPLLPPPLPLLFSTFSSLSLSLNCPLPHPLIFPPFLSLLDITLKLIDIFMYIRGVFFPILNLKFLSVTSYSSLPLLFYYQTPWINSCYLLSLLLINNLFLTQYDLTFVAWLHQSQERSLRTFVFPKTMDNSQFLFDINVYSIWPIWLVAFHSDNFSHLCVSETPDFLVLWQQALLSFIWLEFVFFLLGISLTCALVTQI